MEERAMKTKMPRLSVGLAVVALAAAGTLMLGGSLNKTRAQESAAEDGFVGGQGLGGTWKVSITLANCDTNAAMGSPFTSYLSFAGNGTMSENTSNPGFAVGQRGPGLGVWKHTGWRAYYANSTAFILFSTAPVPPMNPGFTAGTQTITQAIKMSGPDEFSSNAKIQFADGTGTVYRNGCAVATAVRFE
jgi:hypothetical protein